MYLEKKMKRLLKQLGSLNIVQVGAFNGIAGDPLYHFVMERKEVTRILLIEPQPQAVERLRENYAKHPSASVLECAISPDASKLLTLYANEGRGWGSGTTADLGYHEKHMRNRGREVEAFGKLEVACMTLGEALSASGFGDKVDVLQVDCEGYDDKVIYASSIPKIKPGIINYEFALMPKDRQNKLDLFLEWQGYKILRWSERDKCATKKI